MNAGKDGRQELGEWKHGSTGTTLLGMFYNPALSITRVPMLEFHSCELPDISLPDIQPQVRLNSQLWLTLTDLPVMDYLSKGDIAYRSLNHNGPLFQLFPRSSHHSGRAN